MPSPEALVVGLFAGIFGMAYSVYGKRARRPAFLLAGIGLCVYPYLVSGVLLELLIGAILAAVPFVVSSDWHTALLAGSRTPHMTLDVERGLRDREVPQFWVMSQTPPFLHGSPLFVSV